MTSDAQVIRLISGKAPEISIATGGKADGSTMKFKCDGGEDPHLWVNAAPSPRLQGKWIQLVRDSASTLTIAPDNATYATIHLEPNAAAIAAAPSTAPTTAVAVKDTRHTVTAAQLVAAEKAFANGVQKVCPHCQGSGHVDEQEQIGTHRSGAFNVPDYQTVRRVCSTCGERESFAHWTMFCSDCVRGSLKICPT